MASITSNYGLSKPLGSEAPDISVINDNMDTLDSELVVKTSNDIADATATKSTGWTTVLPVAVGEKVASVFEKFSTMAKNIRWIYKFLGTADISSIGDGTVTNALTTLNTAVGKKVNTADIVNNLTSTSTTQPLSANMGKALNDAMTYSIHGTVSNATYLSTSASFRREGRICSFDFAGGTKAISATSGYVELFRISEPYTPNESIVFSERSLTNNSALVFQITTTGIVNIYVPASIANGEQFRIHQSWASK